MVGAQVTALGLAEKAILAIPPGQRSEHAVTLLRELRQRAVTLRSVLSPVLAGLAVHDRYQRSATQLAQVSCDLG